MGRQERECGKRDWGRGSMTEISVIPVVVVIVFCYCSCKIMFDIFQYFFRYFLLPFSVCGAQCFPSNSVIHKS